MPNAGFRLGSRSWRWPRFAAGAVLVVAAAVAVAVVLITSQHESAQAANQSTDPSGAATVQRRDLVETDTESGTLSYNNPQTVYNNLSGTLTWLPQVGQVIKPGHAFFKVDDQPVLLMNGTTPAYRDLSGADTPGSDIKQLNRDLKKLGLGGANIVVNDEWQYATTVGVEKLQLAHGLTETGDLTLGQVVFLPSPQLVGTLDTTVGSASSGSGSSSSSSSSASSSGVPSSSASATAIMQTSSTQLVATVDLDASKQSEAKVGEKVTVQMPAGNTVGGKIIAVSPVAQSSSGSSGSGSTGSGSSNGSGSSGGSSGGGSSGSSSGSSSTIPVTIALAGRHHGAGLDQAAVSVNFAQARANHVLSVPVTALLATAGGGYAVQEASAPHKVIPVTVGLFAAGFVQVSGSGIYSGLQVTDSQG